MRIPTNQTIISLDSVEEPDYELQAVQTALMANTNIEKLISEGLRRSFDEVIDGPRTGRYRIEQLEKTEKTYIGTKVEIVLRNDLELLRGKTLDNLIAGVEVDTKFSLTGAWMIPGEAFDKICLLISGDDNSTQFNVGLLRMVSAVLTKGSNQDKKKTISALGKSNITWLLQKKPLVPNFLLGLEEKTRQKIMSQTNGVQRIRQLFLNVTSKIIPRTAIEQVAQQKDPMRRARQMKNQLASQGVLVLCATYEADRKEFHLNGFDDFRADDWLSIASNMSLAASTPHIDIFNNQSDVVT